FWVWPGVFIWWSLRVGGTYWIALDLGLAVVLLLARLRDEGALSVPAATALGFLGGLAWWANPQVVYLALPGLIWASAALVHNWRRLPFMVAGALGGAAPWLAYNLGHQWASLEFPPAPDMGNSYLDHLHNFFHQALPMALGLMQPFRQRWVLGGIGQILYWSALAAFVATLVRAPSRVRLPLLMATAYPFMYAVSPATWYHDQPRYVLFLMPAVCLLAASGLRRRPLAVVVVALAASLSFSGLGLFNKDFVARNAAPDVPVPASLAPLRQLLTDEHVDAAFADYWLAYRIVFETHERVAATPLYVVRDQLLDAKVRRAARPAYVFVAGSKAIPRLVDYCRTG
ncbi:MAG: hypothetical protein ACREMG_07565, partial [Gemmatimonadales bacterium]